MEPIPKVTLVFLIHPMKLRTAESWSGQNHGAVSSIFIISKKLFLSRQGHSSKINTDSLIKMNSGEVKQRSYTENTIPLVRTHTMLLPWDTTRITDSVVLWNRYLWAIFPSLSQADQVADRHSPSRSPQSQRCFPRPPPRSPGPARCTHLEKAAVGVGGSGRTSAAGQGIHVGRRGAVLQRGWGSSTPSDTGHAGHAQSCCFLWLNISIITQETN